MQPFSCQSQNGCQTIKNDAFLEKNQNKYLDVISEKQYLGKYKMDYINKWNFFDQSGNWKEISGSFLASSEELKLQSKDYTIRKMNSDEIGLLNRMLTKKRISKYSDLSQNQVLEYDFNKDGHLDKIIIASNATDESTDEQLFSIVISVIKNKAEIVDIDILEQYQNYQVPAYYISGVINIFGNKQDYLVLTKGYYSEVGESIATIYQVKNRKLESIVK